VNAASSRGAAALAAVACALTLSACGAADGADSEPEPVPATFFGIMPQAPLTDSSFAEMKSAGIGTFRTFADWSQLEPSPGEYDFSLTDSVVSGAAEQGIEVLPYLLATPPWVAKLDGHACDDDCGLFAPDSPASLNAWRDFITAVVSRYGPRGEFWRAHPDLQKVPIRAWQIWNEQNSPSFYSPRPDVASYAKLVDAAADAIHDVDPGAEVVLGGMFGTPFGGAPPGIAATDYLQQLYSIFGSDPPFDAVGVHPYGAHTSKVIDQVGGLHDVIESSGDDARLWVTEMGWSSDEGDEPLERGLEGQATALTESYDYLLDNRAALNVQGVVWYSWSDFRGAEICAWCAGSGLLTEDGTPKPAWDAFLSFTGGS
jgi:polysaccharide biosynthesis protein PslG